MDLGEELGNELKRQVNAEIKISKDNIRSYDRQIKMIKDKYKE
jgi:hypothetical protein